MFQSSPTHQSGATGDILLTILNCNCFNPHPTHQSGATSSPRVLSDSGPLVSILTQLISRVQQDGQ